MRRKNFFHGCEKKIFFRSVFLRRGILIIQNNTVLQIVKEEAVSKLKYKFEMAFFVSAKKIGQAQTSLSQDLSVSLIFCILGNQAIYPKDNV